MRHYVRLDPLLPDHKADAQLGEDYPDGAFSAFVLSLCWAARQTPPGYFRNRQVLAGLLGKRARWIPFLIEHEDVVQVDGGRLYVEGWNEWQEGQFPTVDARRQAIAGRDRPMTGAERSAAYRARKKAEREEEEASRSDTSRDDVTSRVTERVTQRDGQRLDTAKAITSAESLRENRSPSAKPARVPERNGRVDVNALLDAGYTSVTPKQRRTLDEIADRHDVTGYGWAAERIAAAPEGVDPLAHVMAEDRSWQAERRSQVEADEVAAARSKVDEEGAAKAAWARINAVKPEPTDDELDFGATR